MVELLRRLKRSRVIDLSQPWFQGMPHWPTHPPFAKAMTKLHGEQTLEGGASSAAEFIALGTHVGTHIDALCHFSLDGLLAGGQPAREVQSEHGGIASHSIDRMGPIVRRGVLLDVARLFGGGPLDEDFEILPAHLEEAELEAGILVDSGDVVLIRTGWARYWRQPGRYLNSMRNPGAGIEAARWLSTRGVFAAGSDTMAFERIPSPRMEVHVHLLVQSGIPLIENLNMESLSEEAPSSFVFVASPLKIEGGTGSPIRPFAIIDEEDGD